MIKEESFGQLKKQLEGHQDEPYFGRDFEDYDKDNSGELDGRYESFIEKHDARFKALHDRVFRESEEEKKRKIKWFEETYGDMVESLERTLAAGEVSGGNNYAVYQLLLYKLRQRKLESMNASEGALVEEEEKESKESSTDWMNDILSNDNTKLSIGIAHSDISKNLIELLSKSNRYILALDLVEKVRDLSDCLKENKNDTLLQEWRLTQDQIDGLASFFEGNDEGKMDEHEVFRILLLASLESSLGDSFEEDEWSELVENLYLSVKGKGDTGKADGGNKESRSDPDGDEHSDELESRRRAISALKSYLKEISKPDAFESDEWELPMDLEGASLEKADIIILIAEEKGINLFKANGSRWIRDIHEEKKYSLRWNSAVEGTLTLAGDRYGRNILLKITYAGDVATALEAEHMQDIDEIAPGFLPESFLLKGKDGSLLISMQELDKGGFLQEHDFNKYGNEGLKSLLLSFFGTLLMQLERTSNAGIAFADIQKSQMNVVDNKLIDVAMLSRFDGDKYANVFLLYQFMSYFSHFYSHLKTKFSNKISDFENYLSESNPKLLEFIKNSDGEGSFYKLPDLVAVITDQSQITRLEDAGKVNELAGDLVAEIKQLFPYPAFASDRKIAELKKDDRIILANYNQEEIENIFELNTEEEMVVKKVELIIKSFIRSAFGGKEIAEGKIEPIDALNSIIFFIQRLDTACSQKRNHNISDFYNDVPESPLKSMISQAIEDPLYYAKGRATSDSDGEINNREELNTVALWEIRRINFS